MVELERFKFDDDLYNSARNFLLDLFENNSDYSQDKDIIITTAMCIIEGHSFFEDKFIFNKGKN